MQAPESMYWQKKAEKRTLRLQFDEDDDIMTGIEMAMKQYNINDAALADCKGSIKSGLGNYMAGNRYMTKDLDNCQVKAFTGHFKLSRNGLFGVLKIIPTDFDSHVTIAKAKAKSDFEITLSFYEF